MGQKFKDAEENKIKKGPKFGTRHILIILVFLGLFNLYFLRINMSVTIVAMVNSTSTETGSNKSLSDTCPILLTPNNSESSGNNQNGPFNWDEVEQGHILAAFFYGYVVTQLPGGYLAEFIGGKWLFGGGIFISGLLTLVTPLAANVSFDLLFAVRFVTGLAQGVVYPSLMSLMAKWTAPDERSRFISIAFSGSEMGSVLVMPLCGILSQYFGWEYAFYVTGAIAIVWFIFWCFLAYNNPEDHPRISVEEKTFLQLSLKSDNTNQKKKVPWLKIFTSVPVYALILTNMSQSFGFYILLTKIPTFMKNILHFNIEDNGLLSGLPSLLMAAMAISSSFFFDWLIIKNYLSTTAVRKLANSMALFPAAGALIGITFAGCSRVISVTLLIVTGGCLGFLYSGKQACLMDMSNNFAGSFMGVINGSGNIMGFVTPLVVGYIINDHNDVFHWNIVFYLAAAVNLFGALVFIIFGSAKEQEWNKIKTKEENKESVTKF